MGAWPYFASLNMCIVANSPGVGSLSSDCELLETLLVFVMNSWRVSMKEEK